MSSQRYSLRARAILSLIAIAIAVATIVVITQEADASDSCHPDAPLWGCLLTLDLRKFAFAWVGYVLLPAALPALFGLTWLKRYRERRFHMRSALAAAFVVLSASLIMAGIAISDSSGADSFEGIDLRLWGGVMNSITMLGALLAIALSNRVSTAMRGPLIALPIGGMVATAILGVLTLGGGSSCGPISTYFTHGPCVSVPWVIFPPLAILVQSIAVIHKSHQ